MAELDAIRELARECMPLRSSPIMPRRTVEPHPSIQGFATPESGEGSPRATFRQRAPSHPPAAVVEPLRPFSGSRSLRALAQNPAGGKRSGRLRVSKRSAEIGLVGGERDSRTGSTL